MLHVLLLLLLLLALAASVSMTGAPVFFLLRGFRCEGAKGGNPKPPSGYSMEEMRRRCTLLLRELFLELESGWAWS